MTPEQEEERQAIVTQYGERVSLQAGELSGLRLCLMALSQREMEPDRRAWLYRQASVHLAQLLEQLMPHEHAAKVTECAQKMEAALEMWIADAHESRDTLPPL